MFMSTLSAINNYMSKFDSVYEKILFSLDEEIQYKDSVLVDYVGLLLTALKSQEYFDEPLDKTIKRVMAQEGAVKVFGLTKEGLPPLKLEMSSPQKDKFIVTVVDATNEEDQKTFESDLSTNCIQDVMAYVKEKQLATLGAENNVEQIPPAQGGEAQPGAAGSALPGVQPAAPAAPPA
jgi:hypothetical protein